MKWQDYIVEDEKVLVGKLAVKGTRLSIEFLVGLLAQGWTEKQIMENYPLPDVFCVIMEPLQTGGYK